MGYIGPRVNMDYYRNGVLIARFVRYLKPNECPSCLEKDRMVFIDGNKVYRKVDKNS